MFRRSFNTADKLYNKKLGVICINSPFGKVLNDAKKILLDNGYVLDESTIIYNELQADKNDIHYTITFVVVSEKSVEIEIIGFSETNRKRLKKEMEIIHGLLLL